MVRSLGGHPPRPLSEKLGIRKGVRAAVLNAPEGYRRRLEEPTAAVIEEALPGRPMDFIQFFAVEREELEGELPRLKRALSQDGMLWVSWPKRSSGVKTDLNDRVVREIGLGGGLVDVKVAAIDSIWSGLKFVRRVEDRR